ncbi:GNAT family N-acetyltransferase [Knoellia locipacati]|uniref:GNAT family N-acetyltransferase n=1 Tax=Knoellia locipacati TaxID=882824 RepID=UPI00384FE6BD
MGFSVVPLGSDTWDGFADLVDRNNGIFGGCWCISFHLDRGERAFDHREAKHEHVLTDRAHAALVVDDDGAVQGWAQFGDVDEVPGIKHRLAYEQAPPPAPDWRITCVFVDRRHRGQGVARQAVEGAIDLIERAGGGLVEAIPEATAGREAPGRFLFSATAELFDDLGFERVRQVGKHAWIVSRHLDARA